MNKKKDERLLSEFYELKVSQLIDKKNWEIPLINKDEPIVNVLSILDGRSHVWVVNNLKEKELMGVITRHDVLQTLAPPRKYCKVFGLPLSRHRGTFGTAEDVMSKAPISCSSDEKIIEVLQKMIRHQIRRLAIVEEGKIKGEVTLRSLIHKYYKASQYHPIKGE